MNSSSKKIRTSPGFFNIQNAPVMRCRHDRFHAFRWKQIGDISTEFFCHSYFDLEVSIFGKIFEFYLVIQSL
jgi:hypothetical protein